MTIAQAVEAAERLRYNARFGERDHGPAIQATAKRAFDALCDYARLCVEELQSSVMESA